jgi:hypothetical protein
MTQQNASCVDDGFERQFFEYVLDASVGGNQTLQNTLQILSDADFEWWWNKAYRTSGLLKLLMKEQATGRDFIGTSSPTQGSTTFNGMFIDLWAGLATNSAAFPLAVPYIMPATRAYLFTFTDSSGSTNTVELVFSGFKLWPRQGCGPNC